MRTLIITFESLLSLSYVIHKVEFNINIKTGPLNKLKIVHFECLMEAQTRNLLISNHETLNRDQRPFTRKTFQQRIEIFYQRPETSQYRLST